MLKVLVRFVDRDMLMRYHWGMGIGHKYAWEKETGPHDHPSPQASTSNAISREWGEVLAQNQPGVSQDLGVDEIFEEDNIPAEEELQLVPEGNEHYEHLSDGMNDRENEDLGDGWSDED